MLKSELRKQFKAKRVALSQKEIDNASAKITKLVKEHFIQPNLTVSLFFSIQHQKEVSTEGIYHALKSQNCIVSGSISNFKDHTLKHIQVDELELLKVNAYGIPEPVKGKTIEPTLFDLVFVPLLIADEKGYRVGYGKGFYDRFLSQCREDCLFVGLNFFNPIPSLTDYHKNDIRLTHLVTPDQVYSFK